MTERTIVLDPMYRDIKESLLSKISSLVFNKNIDYKSYPMNFYTYEQLYELLDNLILFPSVISNIITEYSHETQYDVIEIINLNSFLCTELYIYIYNDIIILLSENQLLIHNFKTSELILTHKFSKIKYLTRFILNIHHNIINIFYDIIRTTEYLCTVNIESGLVNTKLDTSRIYENKIVYYHQKNISDTDYISTCQNHNFIHDIYLKIFYNNQNYNLTIRSINRETLLLIENKLFDIIKHNCPFSMSYDISCINNKLYVITKSSNITDKIFLRIYNINTLDCIIKFNISLCNRDIEIIDDYNISYEALKNIIEEQIYSKIKYITSTPGIYHIIDEHIYFRLLCTDNSILLCVDTTKFIVQCNKLNIHEYMFDISSYNNIYFEAGYVILKYDQVVF